MKRVNFETLEETVRELRERHINFKFRAFGLIGILVVAVIAIIVKKYPVSFGLLLAAVAYHLLFFRPFEKQYISDVNESNVLFTIARLLGTNEVMKNGSEQLTKKEIEVAQLVPVLPGQDGVSFYETVQGECRGMKVTVSDVVISEDFRLKDSGTRGKKRVFQNCGCWTHIELPENTRYDFRMFEEDAVPTVMQQKFYEEQNNLKKVPVSEIGLNGNYYLYVGQCRKKEHEDAEDNALIPAMAQKIRMLPPEKFVARFEDIDKYTPGKIAVSVRGNIVDVYIRSRFLAMAVSTSSAPTEQSLTFDPYPELKMILELAENLGV
ncbi:hypothetical protein [Oribacterium sp. WCC10]|uniref:hypothetical protein n=1 Tax=Oribacterium sp. WCC10 TaxID=1855343 RepID=UPI0008E0859D|nr:hypothetical protein [Oribacterium sp. WCC10]SFG77456.1 hypothetical protein SAMN05216356_12714 [Oribacterium sp. WCC10]